MQSKNTLWLGAIVGAQGIGGLFFVVLVAAIIDSEVAEKLFWSLAIVNTFRFSLSFQVAQWMPSYIKKSPKNHWQADMTNYFFLELIWAVLAAIVFNLSVFLAVQSGVLNSGYSVLHFLSVFIFSGVITIYSAHWRMKSRLKRIAVYYLVYWLVRLCIIYFASARGGDEDLFIYLSLSEALFCLYASIDLTRSTESRFQGLQSIKGIMSPVAPMFFRSLTKGGLKEMDIIFVGIVEEGRYLVVYRLIRSVCFSMQKALAPFVDLVFVQLTKIKDEMIEVLWALQSKIFIWSIILVVILSIFLNYSGYELFLKIISFMVKDSAGIDLEKCFVAFCILLSVNIIQVVSCGVYPIVINKGKFNLALVSSMLGGAFYLVFLYLSFDVNEFLFVPAGYAMYCVLIIATTIWGSRVLNKVKRTF